RAQHDERVERAGMLDEHGTAARIERVDAADDGLAAARAVDAVRQQVRPRERSGHEPSPELREDQHRVRHAEADTAARLRLAQGEDAHLRELAPERAIELLLEGAQRIERDAAVAEGADAFLERSLVVAALEVHVSAARAGAAGSAPR